jgi:hypothetical protein
MNKRLVFMDQTLERMYRAEATVATLTAEVARLKALLVEFVGKRDAGYNWWGEGPFEALCIHCETDAIGKDDKIYYPHADDCLVVRARAALTPEDAP